MTKALAVLSTIVPAVLLSAACTVHQADSAPPLTGPSDFAQSVMVTATPDVISRDGHSQSAIVVRVFDATGQPAAGVAVRMDIRVNGSLVDFGTLSARTIVTGTDGRATVTYTAPPPPPTTSTDPGGETVTISALPLGNDAQNSRSFTADVTLVPVGVILPNVRFVPRFTFLPSTPAQGETVTFDASTTGNPDNVSLTYSWNFGDGTTGTGITTSHSFTRIGGTTVTLTVSDSLGRAASSIKVITVAAGTVPTADFNFSPTQPGVRDTVFFNGTTSTPAPGRTLTGYDWIFGDGGSARGSAVTHQYQAPGVYSVTLTVTDDVGQTNTTAKSVTVGSPVPTAIFTFSPTSPLVNDPVVFVSVSSTPSPGQVITDYFWNFGDEPDCPQVPAGGSPTSCYTRTTATTITHPYHNAGVFTVNLVVVDSAGRIASKSGTVTVAVPKP